MPNSKHRKKQLATNRRQLERARRKLQLQNARENESDKENLGQSPRSLSCGELEVTTNQIAYRDESEGDDSSWLGSLYSWCQSGIVQSVEVAKDVVFPTRALKRQLKDAQERLRQVEDELRTMKENESNRKRQKTESSVEALPALLSAPPPPPPPPPPLPPPPPPVPSVSAVPKRRIMTRSKTAKLTKLGKELPAITLEDIKKIKLKSAANKDCTKRQAHAEGSSSSSGFLVSLADLKNVNLRKTKANSSVIARRKSFHCSKDFNRSPPEFCRMKLKRLNHARSPGGTVIRNRDPEEELGEGPTPMLTRALRRKFQVACPISPLGSMSPSPVTSPANTITVPYPSSPLLTPLAPLHHLSPLS